MYIRFSTDNDLDIIKGLVEKCFGDKSHLGVYDHIESRYLLAFENNELVAMTGVNYSKKYNGAEVDWTCVRPDYRGKGIMHKLFERITRFTDEDIYCSCWHIEGKEFINLKSCMEDFGFQEVLKNRVTYDTRYNCDNTKNKCIYKTMKGDNEPCGCCEDLWLRPRKHYEE